MNIRPYSYHKYYSAFSYNNEFNLEVDSLLEDYFSPEELTDFSDYTLVGDYKADLAREFTLDSENKIDISKSLEFDEHEFSSFFSSYEKMLFSHFFFGKLNTYILSGAMGSGKTTTINYIFYKILDLEKYKDTFYIKLDFAKGYGNLGTTINDIMELFNDDFYKKLKSELIERIYSYNLSKSFIDSIKDKKQEFSDFYDLGFNVIERNLNEWDKLPEKEKIFEIFKYIENETRKGSIVRLNLVMYFINFIKSYLSKNNINIIFIYDNIDKLQPVAQRSIFINILSLNAIANVKMIFTMRRSTKAKMDKILSRDENPIFENRAQYTYGHIYHHGPSVQKIYKKKLNQLISNLDEYKIFSQLKSETKNKIINRAKEVLVKFDQNSSFRQAFNCLSGQSKRLALTLAKRPFCNSVIKHDDISPNIQSLVRTLYAGGDSDMRIAINDKYVCNLFSNRENNFTLLNYFILYIIESYHSDTKLSHLKKVNILYDFLYNYFEYSVDEILFSLNYLMSDKRALIGGEYFPKYDTLDELIRLSDKIRITELGDRYYNNLLLNGSIYNQVCLLSLRWKDLNIIDYRNDSIAIRFADLRICINSLRDEEDERFKKLKRNSVINNFEIKIEPISPNIVKLFANSLIAILPSLELRPSLKQELSHWRDLILYMEYLHGSLKKEANAFEIYCTENKISKDLF